MAPAALPVPLRGGQVVFFPAGLFLCFRKLENAHLFAILYGVLASYFSGIMIRLMLTLTPIACVLSALSVSTLLDTYLAMPAASGSDNGRASTRGKVRARATAKHELYDVVTLTLSSI